MTLSCVASSGPSSASGGVQLNMSSGPPHFVDLHVNPGESVSIQMLDGNETILQGPATITMVSQHTFPPVPMPVQVPPGHMVQQIVDENGTLRHIILSALNSHATNTNGGGGGTPESINGTSSVTSVPSSSNSGLGIPRQNLSTSNNGQGSVLHTPSVVSCSNVSSSTVSPICTTTIPGLQVSPTSAATCNGGGGGGSNVPSSTSASSPFSPFCCCSCCYCTSPASAAATTAPIPGTHHLPLAPGIGGLPGVGLPGSVIHHNNLLGFPSPASLLVSNGPNNTCRSRRSNSTNSSMNNVTSSSRSYSSTYSNKNRNSSSGLVPSIPNNVHPGHHLSHGHLSGATTTSHHTLQQHHLPLETPTSAPFLHSVSKTSPSKNPTSNSKSPFLSKNNNNSVMDSVSKMMLGNHSSSSPSHHHHLNVQSNNMNLPAMNNLSSPPTHHQQSVNHARHTNGHYNPVTTTSSASASTSNSELLSSVNVASVVSEILASKKFNTSNSSPGPSLLSSTPSLVNNSSATSNSASNKSTSSSSSSPSSSSTLQFNCKTFKPFKPQLPQNQQLFQQHLQASIAANNAVNSAQSNNCNNKLNSNNKTLIPGNNGFHNYTNQASFTNGRNFEASLSSPSASSSGMSTMSSNCSGASSISPNSIDSSSAGYSSDTANNKCESSKQQINNKINVSQSRANCDPDTNIVSDHLLSIVTNSNSKNNKSQQVSPASGSSSSMMTTSSSSSCSSAKSSPINSNARNSSSASSFRRSNNAATPVIKDCNNRIGLSNGTTSAKNNRIVNNCKMIPEVKGQSRNNFERSSLDHDADNFVLECSSASSISPNSIADDSTCSSSAGYSSDTATSSCNNQLETRIRTAINPPSSDLLSVVTTSSNNKHQTVTESLSPSSASSSSLMRNSSKSKDVRKSNSLSNSPKSNNKCNERIVNKTTFDQDQHQVIKCSPGEKVNDKRINKQSKDDDEEDNSHILPLQVSLPCNNDEEEDVDDGDNVSHHDHDAQVEAQGEEEEDESSNDQVDLVPEISAMEVSQVDGHVSKEESRVPSITGINTTGNKNEDEQESKDATTGSAADESIAVYENKLYTTTRIKRSSARKTKSSNKKNVTKSQIVDLKSKVDLPTTSSLSPSSSSSSAAAIVANVNVMTEQPMMSARRKLTHLFCRTTNHKQSRSNNVNSVSGLNPVTSTDDCYESSDQERAFIILIAFTGFSLVVASLIQQFLPAT